MSINVLSLGWGVQSWTLAVMAVLGEFGDDRPAFAIHADTTFERSHTYEFAANNTSFLVDRGLPVITVQPKANEVRLGEGNVVDIPAFTLSTSKRGKKEGRGQIRRQCTSDWKIAPMRRKIQELRNGEPVIQWIGISWDEYKRMKESDVQYITNVWPLIDRKMTRRDCIDYLIGRGLPVPKKSSCTFCPFHSSAEWRDVYQSPTDWTQAVEVDERIRKARPGGDLFVHPSRRPIAQVDFRTAEELGQLSLWDSECTGICGI